MANEGRRIQTKIRTKTKYTNKKEDQESTTAKNTSIKELFQSMQKERFSSY